MRLFLTRHFKVSLSECINLLVDWPICIGFSGLPTLKQLKFKLQPSPDYELNHPLVLNDKLLVSSFDGIDLECALSNDLLHLRCLATHFFGLRN